MVKRNSEPKRKSEESIDVASLMHSMDHARWDHPLVMKLFKTMRDLQRWLEKQYANQEDVPLVSIVISAPHVALLIGDDCVWESECCNEDDLTVDYCREEMRKEALKMIVPFE